MSRTVHVIRRLAGVPLGTDLTDRQLLERFARGRDETAFAVLVRRHGAMVLGVCRRVLRHRQDAEDAFQAAFLVLARKAASVRWQDSVGGWLFQVAYHLALKMRASAGRRRTCPLPELPGPVPDQPDGELRALLDDELGRLPEKYRTALLLCYYEGKTRAEVARQLGCKEGTVKIRLERGRELLRDRLKRRGLAPSVLPAASLAAEPAPPPALVEAVVGSARSFALGECPVTAASPAAVALAEGVLRAMKITRLTYTSLLVLAVGVLALAVGRWALAGSPEGRAPSTGQQAARSLQPPARPAAQPAPGKAPARRLQVLLFAGAPSRDFQFVRNHFLREAEDEKAELSIHLQMGDVLGVDGDLPRVRVLKKFPTRLSTAAQIEKAGDRSGNLAAYNVIIAMDPDWTKLTKEQLQLLKKWAGMKGHGLIVVAGPVNTRQLAIPALAAQLQPIRDLLPVEVRDDRLAQPPRDPARPLALSFPAPEKFLKLDERGKDPLSGWSEFFFGKPRDDWQKTEDRPRRGIFNPHPVRSIKPAAMVYAAVRDPKARIPVGGKLQDMPYLVAMRYGNGRVIYLGSGESWRLRTFRVEFHARFWNQLVRYAASAGPGR